jgi:hypothetical protein
LVDYYEFMENFGGKQESFTIVKRGSYTEVKGGGTEIHRRIKIGDILVSKGDLKNYTEIYLRKNRATLINPAHRTSFAGSLWYHPYSCSP